MTTNKKILFPTDFSAPSANAFRYALQLADRLIAKIELVHVVFPDYENVGYPTYSGAVTTTTAIDQVKERMKRFVEQSMTQVLGQLQYAPVVTSEVLFGTEADTIIRDAERKEVDFILMATRGIQKSMFEKLMGSVAEGVVENAKCPVLVIPPQVIFREIDTIAYATNLLDADPFEIWKTTELLPALSNTLHLIHLRDVDATTAEVATKTKKLESMREFLAARYSEITIVPHLIPGKSLVKEMEQFLTQHQPALLVMYQTTHGFLEQLFFKSNTVQMTQQIALPLFILKQRQ
ncbi:MAG: universal stress protein [Bacteroidota bacterium]